MTYKKNKKGGSISSTSTRSKRILVNRPKNAGILYYRPTIYIKPVTDMENKLQRCLDSRY